ncbi:S8 family peptidase [Pelagicoccus enzymogenes]|uniref:S8 family peptidase n=1 Tax=Pelagicoccus enzymogenes TaxID=2773457 RepID=UPI001CD4EE9D|nr:S8 family peptidase [Pelagicoccus enzymogenes]
MAGERYPHIQLNENFQTPLAYTRPPRPFNSPPGPTRDRQSHGQRLKQKFEEAWAASSGENTVTHRIPEGVYLEFVSDPNTELVFKRLEDMRSKKVRVVNVREKENSEGQKTTLATVYISNDKRGYIAEKLDDYIARDQTPGVPKNKELVNSIADIKKALLESFWTDSAPLPGNAPEHVEVWLNSDSEDTLIRFVEACGEFEITVTAGSIVFPDRRVLVIEASRQQLETLYQNSPHIAEFRKAKESAAFFLQLEPEEQADWAQSLRERLRVGENRDIAICILDTGVNNGHTLLEPLLSREDQHAAEIDWGGHDHDGHGTLMAGLAAYGDLKSALETQGEVEVLHVLESGKILPPFGRSEYRLYGDITDRAISRAAEAAPFRKRILCMAVTADDHRDRGRPSSWSGYVDKSASGASDDLKKLFVISAGNTPWDSNPNAYPNQQTLESIQDPAQAWNAVTVGAYTNLVDIDADRYPEYRPLAPQGGLSPHSSSSTVWDSKWPLKPDIVLEGGNLAVSSETVTQDCINFDLLTTYYKPNEGTFDTINATSAACAQASWMAAQIQSRYREYWPETIRALLIHSSEWTDTMKRQFLTDVEHPSKGQIASLVRVCGWGVPSLERALYSASNSLTLVSESTLQPYQRDSSGYAYKTKDWHKHKLPWPTEALLNLPPETNVSMRVTLSYFIEPGPGEVGWKDRYKYPSHGLRFGIKKPGESESNFEARVSAATERDDDVDTSGASEYWTLGSDNRHKGSIHSDIWKGSAAELASSNVLAVYPVRGWWAERTWLRQGERECRYSLVVSISTPREDVDLYVPVSTQIGVSTPVEITV